MTVESNTAEVAHASVGFHYIEQPDDFCPGYSATGVATAALTQQN